MVDSIYKTVKTHGEVHKLKVGEVIRYVTDIDHYYWINGKFVPSVTKILDEAGPVGFGLREFWKNNTKQESEQIFKTAGDFGTKMHDASEKLFKGEELSLRDDYKERKEKKALAALANWFQVYAPTKFEPEQVVASLKHGYAGTLDWVGEIRRENWLIDLKFTSAIHFVNKLQVKGYKQAYEESYGIKIDKCAVLRLGTSHKGSKQVKELPETGLGWECKVVEPEITVSSFMNVYNSYKDLHGGKIPEPTEIVDYPDTIQLFEKETK